MENDGREEVREQGRKEERLSIARKMLQKGITLEELKTDYDYSDSEIRILKKVWKKTKCLIVKDVIKFIKREGKHSIERLLYIFANANHEKSAHR